MPMFEDMNAWMAWTVVVGLLLGGAAVGCVLAAEKAHSVRARAVHWSLAALSLVGLLGWLGWRLVTLF